MPFRLLLAVLVFSVLACAGPPKPAPETSAAAIQHFFGEQEEQSQAEKREEVPAPVVEEPEKPAPAPPVEPARQPEPAVPPAAPVPASQPERASARQPEPAPQPEAKEAVEEASPRETPDAIQHFFGEGETPIEVRPEEPAKDQKDVKEDGGSGEEVDAFDHFFGEKPPATPD